ncbi:MAG: VWA domain-containing protein, partial [Mycobacterium sp.]|nr:VWA domain-containing protein [Mycobacterium sp.]
MEQIFGQLGSAKREFVDHNAATSGVGRLGLLGSAWSGRPLDVVPSAAGEPAWTDGAKVYLDPTMSTADQRRRLAVQASLLAADSLRDDVVRRFSRRPALARRYLAVEGHRALAQNGDLLPPSVRSLIDRDEAARSDSPDTSLTIALGREAVADPPADFGVIRARNLLSRSATPTGDRHSPRAQSANLAELDNDVDADVADIFTSPVGGGGGLGRLLQKMLSAVRKLDDGGAPGADAPTHRSRNGPLGGGKAVVSTAFGPAEDGTHRTVSEFTYPEWDIRRRRYRPDWCAVQEVTPEADGAGAPPMPDDRALRRPLARLGVGLQRCRRQPQGDDLDIDAVVEAQVELKAGSAPDEAVYLDSVRRRRDLSVLLLLDTSGSVAERGAAGGSVHDLQRTAAAALMVALHDLGDRVALYAFQSQGRSAVRMMPVKHFDDDVTALTMRRLHSLRPGAYSRLGAAIRHGANVLERRGGTSRRLLVV